MKVRLTSIAALVGASMILMPIVFEMEINRWVHYTMAVIGGVLCAIARYDAMAERVGLGNTGEELLQRLWKRLRNKLRGKSTEPEDPLGWRKAKESYESSSEDSQAKEKDHNP